MMSRNSWILLAIGGSAGLLLGAFAFQYLGGLAPCKMCIWQRWPHGLAIVIGLIAWRAGIFAWLGGLVVAVGAGIGFYHAGVETGLFSGPDSCTSGPIGNQSAEELLASILNTPLVRCDEIAWSLFGISMAGWNAVLSVVLVVFWIKAAIAKA